MTLVAASSLLIATKYEEIYPPTGHELLNAMCKCKSTEEPYTHEDLLKMEFQILTAIEFQICETSSLNFLARYVLVGKSNKQDQFTLGFSYSTVAKF